MENRYYQVIITGKTPSIEPLKSPCTYYKNYRKAIKYAKPWVEHGYNVIITSYEGGLKEEID